MLCYLRAVIYPQYQIKTIRNLDQLFEGVLIKLIHTMEEKRSLTIDHNLERKLKFPNFKTLNRIQKFINKEGLIDKGYCIIEHPENGTIEYGVHEVGKEPECKCVDYRDNDPLIEYNPKDFELDSYLKNQKK